MQTAERDAQQEGASAMPATDRPRIVRTKFQSEGVINLPPEPGSNEPQALNLFTADKSVWFFQTDDGRFAQVPVDNALIRDDSFGFEHAERVARGMAMKLLQEKAAGPTVHVHLDGEKIAEAVASATKDEAALS